MRELETISLIQLSELAQMCSTSILLPTLKLTIAAFNFLIADFLITFFFF